MTVAASSVSFVSGSELKVVVPAESAGAVDVRVWNPAGYSSAVSADVYAFGAPSVSKVAPAAGPTAGGNTVTVSGSGFVSGSEVKFGSVTVAASSVSFVSGSELKVVVPAESAGGVDVRVWNPAGYSSAVSADVYAFGAPSVTKVDPAAGPTAGGNTVVVSGSGFVPGSTVKFGSVTLAASSVSFVSGSELKAVVPAGSAGTVDVRVWNPAGYSPAVSADVYAFGAPSVTKVNPVTGLPAGGNTVTVSGSGFVSGSTVKFGSVAASSVSFVSGSELKAVAPAESAGTVDVRVWNPAGYSPAASADRYVFAAPLTISSFTPTTAPTGTDVTVTGSGFVAGTSAKLVAVAAGNGVLAASATVLSSTQLRVVVPDGAVPARIEVTTPAGSATSSQTFTPSLSITGATPETGLAGTVVTINGVGFNTGSAVKFHGVAASKVKYVSSTQLQATVPSGATTGPVSVTNAAAPVGTVDSAFSFTPNGQIITFTSAAPAGATVGGASYTVTATGGPSGNPVIFAIASPSSSVCSLSGATVTFIAIGTCTVDANQAGNATYSAATQVQQSFSVGHLYWYAGNNIERSDLSGASLNHSLIAAADPQNREMALDASHIYWISPGQGIGRANLDGSDVNQGFIATSASLEGVAVAGSYIYWSVQGGSGDASIARANMDGSGVDQTFITGLSDAGPLVVAGPYIYWTNTDSNSIGRANLDGSDVIASFVSTGSNPTGLAVEGPYLYWTDEGPGTIGRANVDGSDANQDFITGANLPTQVAVDGADIYWTGSNEPGSIGRANLDGTDVNESFVAAQDHPSGIVLGGPGAQAIKFTSTAPTGATVGGASYTVTATGGLTGNPVSFTIDSASSSVCAIAGATVTFTAPGTCTIDANQAGNTNYDAASEAQQTFSVSAAQAKARARPPRRPSPASRMSGSADGHGLGR